MDIYGHAPAKAYDSVLRVSTYLFNPGLDCMLFDTDARDYNRIQTC